MSMFDYKVARLLVNNYMGECPVNINRATNNGRDEVRRIFYELVEESMLFIDENGWLSINTSKKEELDAYFALHIDL